MELKNAVQMAQKEIQTRFDFKDSGASIVLEEKPATLSLSADHPHQLRSMIDLLQTKLVKRGIPLKALEWEDPQVLPSGGAKQRAKVMQGIPLEKAKEIVKIVRSMGLKVEARVEGDTVRVSGRQIDDLQKVIQVLKERDVGVPLQFENYR